jgi:23S rRNA pseudouridine2605 synthase
MESIVAEDDLEGETDTTGKSERIAKVIARAGVCSRRDAEKMILEGRVTLDGELVTSPARIGRVVSVGRLDFNSEGLLLLTNDGEIARRLEVPAAGWIRKYRARLFGKVNQKDLDNLATGVTIDGITYGPIVADIERAKGNYSWATVSLKEGKNREVKRVMESLGLKVARLIRISYGPFQLGHLAEGAVEEIPTRLWREQLGIGRKKRLEAAHEAPWSKPGSKPDTKGSKPDKAGAARGKRK